LRKGIVTGAFNANIKTSRERHGPRARKIMLEPREEFVQRALPAEQQPMDVPRLGRPGPMHRLGGQTIALQNDDLIEVVGERSRGREPSNASADHYGPLPDLN
jgi:hypothetical protein